MATVLKAPFDPPAIDFGNHKVNAQENNYVRKISEAARENGTSDLLGKEIRFPVADSYACYVVWNTAPLELIWLEIGDAWSAPEPLIRGLNEKDVQSMVCQQERLEEFLR